METLLTVRGVIHGKTVALLDDVGLPEGQAVAVTLKPVNEPTEEQANAALLRSFGAWAEDAEDLDKYLAWAREQRKVGRRPIEP